MSAGLEAVDAAAAVGRALERHGDHLVADGLRIDLEAVDRVLVVAAGKAAAPMVRALENILGDRLSSGIGVTVAAHAGNTARSTLYAGGHPTPDAGSLVAARRIAALLATATAQDLVVVLLSGGASALMALPAPGISLADLQAATGALLSSGATINEQNTIRKHISLIKGGHLAALAAPAQTLALVISDVVGDRLDVIGSGPTGADPETFADAVAVVERHGLRDRLPPAVWAVIEEGAAGRRPETPKPGDEIFARTTTRVIASNRDAATAAGSRAQDLGYHTAILTTFLEGEAREAARVLAAIGMEIAAGGSPVTAPGCLVFAGETTVTLRRLGGRGGRNQELALAAAMAVEGWEEVAVASMGTDGIDGATGAAGAIVDGTTVARARAAGLDPQAALQRHDSGVFFASLGDSFVCGPTGTNVNDLGLVLVAGPGDGPG
ncbi:MAG: glycerate kinase [Anaerolineae bacterium]